jgi:hypothetical protein
MNKKELVIKVAAKAQVGSDECLKVIDALEAVLSEAFSDSGSLGSAFDKAYSIMSFFKKKKKSSMKQIVSIVAFVFFCIAAQAQNSSNAPTQTVRGVITDRSSGQPLSYVTVGILNKPGLATTTNNEGEFEINKVPVGRYDIQATSIGFDPSIYREVPVTSAKEVYLEIQMKENVRELAEVTVRPQVNKEQSLNKMATTGARMLSVEEAGRYAGGFDDPARLVSSFAGVASGVASNGISVHGNAPQLLQWRLEGVEIPNPNHFADISVLGGGVLSSLSSHVLGNSDFFTGSLPAEYNNAVSGVFDMNLRNGNNQRNENTIQVGIMGIDVASEGPLSTKHKSSYLFNYRYSTTGLLSKVGMDLTGTLDYQDLNFKFNFPTRKAGIFSVWGTSLIDKAKPDFDEDPAEWKYGSDRLGSNAKQYVAAGGLTHKYYFNNGALLKSAMAATCYMNKIHEESHNTELTASPYSNMKMQNTNLVFTSMYSRKFNSRLTNQTGITYTKMFYDMNLDLAPVEEAPLQNISRGKGNTDLISVYNSSSVDVSPNVSLNMGLNSRILTLNNHRTLEPRAGIKWQMNNKSSLAFAYGLHSRMETTDVYFVKTKATGDEWVNKDLDFTKAHHLMLTFQYKLSEDMNLKIEPYFQRLYDVPVVADSSYSILNRGVFYVEDALVNKGKGQNSGIDVTLERYLKKGLYYMITASLFDSRYSGGDGVWHSTKFNRRYIMNGLIGKEWMMGRNKQNMLSANLKLTVQGGNRYSPIDEEATLAHPFKEVQYDETKAYSEQLSPMFIANATVSYKMNRIRTAHEFAVKMLNVTGCEEYYGHDYNIQTHVIEPHYGKTSLFNISYKLEF